MAGKTIVEAKFRPGPAAARGEKTKVWPAGKHPTYAAPVSDPFGHTRPATWDVYSRDGLWHYFRMETGRRLNRWAVRYIPTGQIADGFSGEEAAREATAAGLVDQLRNEAYSLALNTALGDERRQHGQKLLAVHLRTSGKVQGVEAQHRCECGGFLAVVTSSGDLAHFDACDRCYRYGRGLPVEACAHAAEHLFCAQPQAAGLANGCGLWLYGCCPSDCRPG